MKRFCDNKGSTMMMVVITIAVLGTLGTALLAMSLMNVNMKYNDTRIKKTLYYAESGIDQVYARVGEFVENAIDDALIQTDVDMQVELKKLDELLSTDTAQESDPYIIKAPNGDFIIDTEALEVFADQRFKYHFKYYINNNYADGGIDFVTKDIVNLSSGSKIDIKVGSVDRFPTLTGTGEVYVFNDVESTFIYKDNTEKIITTDIVISDDIGAYPVYTKEKHVSLPDNPLWQQALVANEDITFNNAKSTINGNVFGYGTKPSLGQSDSVLNYGGVIVSGSSNVTINNANLVSRSHVQLGRNASNNSRLEVNNGLVYANSLVIQKKSSGSSGDIYIRGNVYTSDDIELNGNGGSIRIDGSYYGYTDGSDRVGNVTHDLSSAIVVNADVTSSGFGLDIEPLKDTSNNIIPNTELDYNERSEGILIGGTAYVDVTDAYRYQTGESVSLKGNFIAYTWAYDQETVNKIVKDNIFIKNPYLLYQGTNEKGHKNRVNERMLSDNIDWETVNGIPFADGVLATNGTFNLSDRMAYFVAFKEYVDVDDAFIKTSTPSIINLDDYIYSTGLQLTDVSVTNNDYVYNANAYNNSEFDYLRVSIRDDYRYLLNKLSIRGGGTSGEKLSDIENVWVESAVAPKKQSQVGDIDNINVVEKYSLLDTELIQESSLAIAKTAMPNTTSDTTTYVPSQDVIYIDSASANPLHIYPDGYSGTMESNHLQSSAMKGIIITNSDIIVHGDLTFYGPIISNGDISFLGGNHQLYNDLQEQTDLRKFLIDMIYGNDSLYKLFSVKYYAYAGEGMPEVKLGLIEYTEVSSTQGYQPQNNSAQNYHEYISFRYWKVKK